MRPSYGPVANSPVADQPAGALPLETFQACSPLGVNAATPPPSVTTVTSRPSGDHAGRPRDWAWPIGRGAVSRPVSQSVSTGRSLPPVVYARLRLSGDQARPTAYCDGNPFACRRRKPLPSRPTVQRLPPKRSLTKATSFPFGDTSGCVSCHGLWVRFTTRPSRSAR